MVLFLKMDQNNWAKGDFTDSATFDLSGTVYDDSSFTTVRNISGFTGTFRIIDQEGGTIFSSDDIVTLNSDGTFFIKFLESQTPTISGIFKIRLRLEVSGSRLTAVGINGSDDIYLDFD
tara:strand:+ start:279 stop:635 length:357 start_codon:yes stop_codon:yes gene_type:complete